MIRCRAPLPLTAGSAEPDAGAARVLPLTPQCVLSQTMHPHFVFPQCLQARLSLMLELLGERNERIEQLELDVQVGTF